MFDGATIDAIARGGGWVVAVLVLAAVVAAFIAGKLVSGKQAQAALDREIKRGDMATAQIERMTDNDERRQRQTDELASQLKVVIEVVTQVLGKQK